MRKIQEINPLARETTISQVIGFYKKKFNIRPEEVNLKEYPSYKNSTKIYTLRIKPEEAEN
jgi:hypothetical protein